MAKRVVEFPRPMPAGQECLPHAAMNLGQPGGSNLHRPERMVHRLVIDEEFGNWVIYRLDGGGGYIGDTWHGSREDAAWQLRKEFGVEIEL